MQKNYYSVSRRKMIKTMLLSAVATMLPSFTVPASSAKPETKPIPGTGEKIPLVGLGSWITFNVGNDRMLLDECVAVMANFFAAGGRLIDSSPMYGSSQPAIGFGLKQLGYPDKLFSAEKVWISNAAKGPEQIEQSRAYWGVSRFDLLQIHNLLSWQEHLKTLREMKAARQLRYLGITTSEGRGHDLLERIMRTEPLDFVQFTYNIVDREAETRLLPLARDRGIAVIVNRPFQQGMLTRRLSSKPLPKWASELGTQTWAQFILKFIVSHPAVTCAIPATSRVDHVLENLAAASQQLPDENTRRRMAAYVREL
jgi:diketogulonate reductase-like aldo/keto reductase